MNAALSVKALVSRTGLPARGGELAMAAGWDSFFLRGDDDVDLADHSFCVQALGGPCGVGRDEGRGEMEGWREQACVWLCVER